MTDQSSPLAPHAGPAAEDGPRCSLLSPALCLRLAIDLGHDPDFALH